MPHRIAIVGAGRMGTALCARLASRGHAVTAHDIRPERAQPVRATGAHWADSLADAVSAVDAVITSLPGAPEVMAIADPLSAALRPGAVWLECSSAAPGAAPAIATAAARAGAAVIDAPLGGGPPAAAQGGLHAFVGGTADDVARARPILDEMVERALEVGPLGAGYTVKLLANLLWFGQAVAHAEAFALAAKAGLDVELVRRAIGESAAASAFAERDAPSLLRGDPLASYSLAGATAQLQAVTALGAELGVPMEVAGAVTTIHEWALARYGAVDGELLGALSVGERAGAPLSGG